MPTVLKTSLTVASSMIGSITLVAPTLFKENGILSCLVLIVIVGIIYCKTCQLWSKHQAEGEQDISEVVKRILGRKWEILLGITSGIFMLLVCIIYYLLLNKTLYPTLALILVKCGVSQDSIYLEADGVHFDKFSVQYLNFILALCAIPLVNLKSIDRVLVAARYGTIALFLYFLMIVVMFVVSLAEKQVHEVKLWAEGFDSWIQIAGNFSLAFISHTTIVAVMKDSENPKENTKAITYAYVITAILYGLLGVFGGIAISTHDYLLDPPFLITKGILIFLYIGSIYGLFPYTSRRQFFCFLPKLQNWQFYGFNAVIWLSCVVFQTLNVTPGSVISITGAGVGLFVCFIIPIYIHIKCYYPNWQQPSTQQPKQSTTQLAGGINQSRAQININQDTRVSQQSNTPQHPPEKKCLLHNRQRWSFPSRLVIYGVLLLLASQTSASK